jgi:hypothetical protein
VTAPRARLIVTGFWPAIPARSLPGRPTPDRLRPCDLIEYAVRWGRRNPCPEA